MKYSMKSLDYALDYLLPEIKTAKNLGITFNRPTLIDMVAKKYFSEQFNEDRRDYKESMCYFVCHEACADLLRDGCFNFGTMDLEEDVW